eukprot:CAMPEP_0195024952 /NCGR_PEP_ID=MMETSP0326_2-20130528/46544_1 /TAXON_ID=2866 ORGANISM="Crypthecodinium cohnii, Strain Seligo" /NCGR_SAMPLE_ID=MMETSP0326_2 /ASSEMBLY_ACC=CAM_ASM_000348 /LENGTH=40 /DNA_ID= /DNA_START= /DNA_END= /DNA_ORIENTATION=
MPRLARVRVTLWRLPSARNPTLESVLARTVDTMINSFSLP